ARSVLASANAGTSIMRVALFLNATYFLGESDFGMAVLTFFEALADRDVLYIADDEGDTVYNLPYCTAIPTSVPSASAACYINTSTNVTLYLPHFSGGALGNDTQAPSVNVTSPQNGSTLNNSFVTMAFTVYEANPNTATFCNYTFGNSSTTLYSSLTSILVTFPMTAARAMITVKHGTTWQTEPTV
ncbi:hypothetical protein COY95_04425, partial [Candidatus Woesearchaeota archaeon CG_4_10_14_0_8_um_filter_47_5]